MSSTRKAPRAGGPRRASRPRTAPARLAPAERRRDLIRVAAEVMTRDGVDAVVLGDVAVAGGVSRQFVYRFFPSRQALIRAVLEDFADALTRLGMPYRVGFTMTMAFRLVPVFVDAATTVVQAQRCRGLDFERGGLWQRARRYVPVIVPVFMGALRRADQMAMALDARGFQRGAARTALDVHPVRFADVVAGAALMAVVASYVALALAGRLRLV